MTIEDLHANLIAARLVSLWWEEENIGELRIYTAIVNGAIFPIRVVVDSFPHKAVWVEGARVQYGVRPFMDAISIIRRFFGSARTRRMPVDQCELAVMESVSAIIVSGFTHRQFLLDV